MTVSCIYEGTIRHRRLAPAQDFRHRLALTYIDLDELPELLDGRLTRRGPGLLRFRRRDYLGDTDLSLDRAVRTVVEEQTGIRPSGPVRLLTQLRSFGHCFNPVSFYYCMDEAGDQVQAIVVEVTNTPWGERHSYVLTAERAGSEILRADFEKAMHVSPFMGMDHRYRCRASTPGDTVSVHIESTRKGAIVFDATLGLRRRELTRSSVARLTMRYPLATLRVLALIYGHAVALKLAGARIHGHPRPA